MEYFQKILTKAMLMTGCKSLSQVSSDILLRNLLEDSHAMED
jgi:isopentenyl diphosphate isomerase/L-lactate dehydrogenase-like FMN-dependent dehydrogenase